MRPAAFRWLIWAVIQPTARLRGSALCEVPIIPYCEKHKDAITIAPVWRRPAFGLNDGRRNGGPENRYPMAILVRRSSVAAGPHGSGATQAARCGLERPADATDHAARALRHCRMPNPLPPGGHRRPACSFRHQGLAAPSTMYVRNFPALSRSGASASAAFA